MSACVGDYTCTTPHNVCKGVLHAKLKISFFCVLFENQHFLEKKIYMSKSKLSEEPKNGSGILVGQNFLKLVIKTVK